jgi:hypothetical protein
MNDWGTPVYQFQRPGHVIDDEKIELEVSLKELFQFVPYVTHVSAVVVHTYKRTRTDDPTCYIPWSPNILQKNRYPYVPYNEMHPRAIE